MLGGPGQQSEEAELPALRRQRPASRCPSHPLQGGGQHGGLIEENPLARFSEDYDKRYQYFVNPNFGCSDKGWSLGQVIRKQVQ